MVHEAQRMRFRVNTPRIIRPDDPFSDPVLRRVLGIVGEEFHRRAEDVGRGFIQATRLTEVSQIRFGGGHAMGHLMAGNVERYERVKGSLAVAIRHAEAAIAPEGVLVPFAAATVTRN